MSMQHARGKTTPASNAGSFKTYAHGAPDLDLGLDAGTDPFVDGFGDLAPDAIPFEETFNSLLAAGPDRIEAKCSEHGVTRDEMRAAATVALTNFDGTISEDPEGYLQRLGDDDLDALGRNALHERQFPHGMAARGLDRCGGCGQFVTVSPRIGSEHVCANRIGRDAERISVAEARRLMAPGTRLQVVYPNRVTMPGHEDPNPEPDVRIVTKQTAHEMISVRVAGEGAIDGNGINMDRNGVHNDWAKKTVERDAAGNLIVRDEGGTPYVAFIPLAADAKATPLDEIPPFDPSLRTHYTFARYGEDPATLAVLADGPLMADRRAVAENEHTPAEVLSRLAGDEEVDVRRKVAGNPNTPADNLWRLAADLDTGDGPNKTGIGYMVAANPNAPVEALARLASRDDEAIRNRVASHPNTSRRDLVYLATTPRPGQTYVDGQTRQNLAANPNTPADLLAGWENSDGWTMPNVAKNPSTPADVLERMSHNTSTGNQVRAMVAKNPSAPRAAFQRLVSEEDAWVREHAASNPRLTDLAALDTVGRLARDPNHRVRRALASNPSLHALELAPLASDEDPFVRSTLAKNPRIGTGTILALSGDENASVRMNLARNPAVPIEIVERLAHEDGNVGKAAHIALAERQEKNR
jgi:hypothetical protein